MKLSSFISPKLKFHYPLSPPSPPPKMSLLSQFLFPLCSLFIHIFVNYSFASNLTSSSPVSSCSPSSLLPSPSPSSPLPSSASSASSPFPSVKREDIERCLDRLVFRMRALNGPFFSQAQGIHVGWKSMDMYLAEKMTIEQIADYFYYNYNSLSLSPEQYQILADIYAGVVQIMGNSENATDSLYEKGISAAVCEIWNDKAEADQMIERMESEGKTLAQIQLAICRFIMPRVTAQRKRQIVMAIGQMIPPGQRLAIRDQIRKAVWIE